jgi:methenyltetrahydrofolate cyclohydrolase
VGELLERLAARTPAPGGGSAAALACSLAAALVEMAAAFDQTGAAGDAGARATELRELALGLAERDLESYAPVLEALALAAEDPRRPVAVAAALGQATDVPLRVARAGAEVCSLAARVTASAGRHAVGDAVTAAVLSQAACRAAAMLVELNLKGTADERPGQAAQCVHEADVACQQALLKAHES